MQWMKLPKKEPYAGNTVRNHTFRSVRLPQTTKEPNRLAVRDQITERHSRFTAHLSSKPEVAAAIMIDRGGGSNAINNTQSPAYHDRGHGREECRKTVNDNAWEWDNLADYFTTVPVMEVKLYGLDILHVEKRGFQKYLNGRFPHHTLDFSHSPSEIYSQFRATPPRCSTSMSMPAQPVVHRSYVRRGPMTAASHKLRRH